MTTPQDTMPPLPEPEYRFLGKDHYLASQMHAYARTHAAALQSRCDALEAALAAMLAAEFYEPPHPAVALARAALKGTQ